MDLKLGKAYTFGFGSDHVSNDYNVFRVYSYSGEHPVIDGFVENISKVEMFRLSTGLWDDITRKVNLRGICRRSQADLKGMVHWIGMDKSDEVIIVAFDMHNEVFGVMKLPKVPENADWVHMLNRYLHVFEGKLYLFRHISNGTIGDSSDEDDPDGEDDYNREVQYESWQYLMNFDVWRMEEYGVSESWTQLHSGAFNISAHPLGFRNNGNVLWGAICKGLVSSKIGRNEFTLLGECEDSTFHPLGSSYIESLVLLDKTIPNEGKDDLVGILED